MKHEPMSCPTCSHPAVLRHGSSRYRRGERVLSVVTAYWECGHGCVGADGEEPFSFEDSSIARANDAAARAAWRERFGQAMPAAKRPGRKTETPRRRRVPVLMSEDELLLLDQLRGTLSRGAYLRRVMKQAAADDGGRLDR